MKKQTTTKAGFTIVELLIVIVVIGILAAIITVAYNGLQKRAITSVLQSDLHNSASLMQIAQVEEGSYPLALPSGVKSSPGVTLTLSSGGGEVYSGLSSVQNGLLFYMTCQQMLSEGLGQKVDDGHHYVSACNVYNKNQIHIDGWNGRNINTPLTAASLQTYVSSYSGGQKDLFTTNGGNFMNQLTARFQAAGGTFPVAGFWDSWATSTNGGVVKPTLPAPSGGGSVDPTTFCIDATYATNPVTTWHVDENNMPSKGSCR